MKNIQTALILVLFGLTNVQLFSQTTSLTNDEKADVLYLLEEEKLARDVYLNLGEKWDVPVFKNILVSEQRHLNSVRQIAEENKLTIPKSVLSDEKGKFENENLQNLYNQLVAEGNKSLIDALKVGAKIEESDIRDLDEAVAETEKENLKQVYTQLRKASENHLRAFVQNMKKQDLDYQPVLLSKAEFDKIIASENSKGACCSGKKGKEACKGEKSSGQACGGGQKGKTKGKGCCSKPAG